MTTLRARLSAVVLITAAVVAGQATPLRPAEPGPITIYVLGDSLAQSLHFGLEQAYGRERRVSVVKATKVSSGIVRDDFFDWKARADALAGSSRMDVVVMMLGGNDAQPIRLPGGGHARPLSDAWREEYSARVSRVMRSFVDRGVAMYWIGVPILRAKRPNTVGRALNDLFRVEADRVGVRYVDTYAMFADAEGRYATHLVDDAGKRRLMRDPDGAHLSIQGALWLGRRLRRIIDDDLGAERRRREAEAAARAGAKPSGDAAVGAGAPSDAQ